jgi:DNA-binding MarR family transcriptional regulator
MIDKMSNVSRLVDKLVSKDLAKKVRSNCDLRSVDILLTEKGIALLAELTTIMDEYDDSFCGLNESEISLINTLLEKLRNNR